MSVAFDTSGFDVVAQRAVEASAAAGASEEAAEIASKSKRIMRPSMAVSMLRGRRHVAANVDPANVGEDEAMDIEPMDIKPLDAEAFIPPEEAVIDLGLDPIMVWKAGILRALRGAEGGPLALEALEAQFSNPCPETEYNAHIQQHFIARNLAKWVVDNKSIQLAGQ